MNLASGSRVVRTLRTKGLNVVDNVDVDAVQVTVTVTNDNGEFVSGLPRSAFQIYEDGTTSEWTGPEGSRTPAPIVEVRKPSTNNVK